MSESRTIGVLRVLTTALVCAVAILALTQTIDKRAAQPVDAAFERALVTFAVVRGINAVVSVVQGTELAIEPAGVGVILTPGQVFDPVNDLIERFSWIMLLASTSLGAQKLMIEMGSSAFLQGAMIVACLFVLVCLWKPQLVASRWRSLFLKAALLVLLVRLAVPAVVIVNDWVYQSFLDTRFSESYNALEQTRDEVEALQAAEQQAASSGNESFLARIERWYDRTTQTFNVEARIAEYKQRFATASEHIVHLIVVFLLQTVFFPLLFLWLLVRISASVVRSFSD
ncbi:MAG: hypothetical protein AAF434_18320 [Pseudomonadota bacterium]